MLESCCRMVAAQPVWSGGSQGRGRPFTRSLPPPRTFLLCSPSPSAIYHTYIHTYVYSSFSLFRVKHLVCFIPDAGSRIYVCIYIYNSFSRGFSLRESRSCTRTHCIILAWPVVMFCRKDLCESG